MSGHHKFRTEITIAIAGVEHEWPATIIYARRKGNPASLEGPEEPASVEVAGIKILGWRGEQIGLPDQVNYTFYDDPEIIAALMDHWQQDDANAAEYRAESRAESLSADREAGE